jgi:sigma-B regulation protein RsbU (phosphoserine phosphatase)
MRSIVSVPRFGSRLEMQMKTIWRAAAQLSLRLILRRLVVFCAFSIPLTAQVPSASPDSLLSTAGVPTSAGVRTVLTLNGPWRFQEGDDLTWAEPGFDDSNWRIVNLDQSLSEQGFEPYSGYAWYRLRLQPEQLSQLNASSPDQPIELLVASEGIGQLDLFLNGLEAGHTRGMTERPSMYQSPPFVARLSGPDATGTAVLAIRSWAGPTFTIGRGLLNRVELGTHDDIADRLAMAIGRQWNEHVIAAMVVTFLFLSVSVLGAALYLAQRHHAEYLWLALLCLSVAAGGAADAAFGLAVMPVSAYRVFTLLMGRIFMAVTLEFVLRFTATQSRRYVRIFQLSVLLLPIIALVELEQAYAILSVAAQVVFCGMVCVMLFRAWRRGRQEAGIMLLPFFLAAIADSVDSILDFAASKHWLPEQFASHRFHFGPIEFGTGMVAYTAFLASLVAVILYRFIRVSEDEQRSEAEIAAARSVQALLIPTQLPSTRNFMLESAYLPVNGVGGDFFQVLPLKDDSLLIVVGDVSGKGLQAAMNSSTLVGALRNELSHDPATVLDHLNHVLLGAVSSPGAVPGLDSAPCFATCLCARIYPDGTATIANAGHLSPYRDGREVELPPGLPLGVIADMHYEQTTFQLNRGDRLVFLSDGVVEATNPQGELFGFERTQQVSNEPARYIAQTAKRFGQTDDITVVSLYVSSRAAQRNNQEVAHSH